jgi:hypothetical protein
VRRRSSLLLSADSPEEIDDRSGWAINRPAGQLAEFWIHIVRGDWRAAGDEWTVVSFTAPRRADPALIEATGPPQHQPPPNPCRRQITGMGWGAHKATAPGRRTISGMTG